MSIRVVHGSDWHGRARKCPPADLYVFTGDMLANYPVTIGRLDWRIERGVEEWHQGLAMAEFVGRGGMRRLLGSPDAPIVCVRGNHDFVPIAPLFGGCNLVHEFVNNETVDIEIAGRKIRITGHRGIPYIMGTWNDEMSRADLTDRMRAMPPADIYLTHYAPADVLDEAGAHYGLACMADHLIYRADRALHCFGHIHECGGQTVKHGEVIFSNAACSVNELTL